ncbi:UNKNOWN [Stylonychia lemnae]|uniref:Transmembrane protein n=1 Tax=Stylonychia lemnae TaxID=5949 RepID=A0A078A5C8_STYLE|nr:UNKNOWN [Stylonychia lemnae]|eukprot:CDW75964.1 UNKNOWN [Stylonychia lemnae]
MLQRNQNTKIIQDDQDEDLDLKYAIVHKLLLKVIQELEKIQKFHFLVCKKLMIFSMVLMFFQSVYAFYWAAHWSQSSNMLYALYEAFIERFQFSKILHSYQRHESNTPTFKFEFVHYSCVLLLLTGYPVSDFMQCLITFLAIRSVKMRKQQLRDRKDFEEFKDDLEHKLKDIMYLPVEYESDIPEDDDDL